MIDFVNKELVKEGLKDLYNRVERVYDRVRNRNIFDFFLVVLFLWCVRLF